MDNEILLALLVKKVEQKLRSLPEDSPIRGPRGQRGAPGRAGKDFDFEEVAPTIRDWVKEFSLKFKDLSNEEIEKLRGPKGEDGKDGRDFEFEEHRSSIEKICGEHIDGMSDSLKLKFSDLTSEDINILRGPRGRDGRDGRDGVDGKDFVFEDHLDFFRGLKPTFKDFNPEDVEALKLKFSDLSDEDKASLKLRFTDLTEDERLTLRGDRGPRGQRGAPGRDGVDGLMGPRGPQGIMGVRGLPGVPGRAGVDGLDGSDGKDAPYITDISVNQVNAEQIEFVFDFSDGTTLRSNLVRLPKQHYHYHAQGASMFEYPSDPNARTIAKIMAAADKLEEFTYLDPESSKDKRIETITYTAPSVSATAQLVETFDYVLQAGVYNLTSVQRVFTE